MTLLRGCKKLGVTVCMAVTVRFLHLFNSFVFGIGSVCNRPFSYLRYGPAKWLGLGRRAWVALCPTDHGRADRPGRSPPTPHGRWRRRAVRSSRQRWRRKIGSVAATVGKVRRLYPIVKIGRVRKISRVWRVHQISSVGSNVDKVRHICKIGRFSGLCRFCRLSIIRPFRYLGKVGCVRFLIPNVFRQYLPCFL